MGTIKTITQPIFSIEFDADKNSEWPDGSLVLCQDTSKMYELISGAWIVVSDSATMHAAIAALSTVATTGNYNDLISKPTIPSVTNIPRLWLNGVQQSNVKEVDTSAVVSGGTAVFYLTDNGLSTGNALFTTVFQQSLNVLVNDATNQYQFGGYTVSSDKKTLTLTINKIGLSVGILVFTSAANGVTIYLQIKGI